MVWTERSGVVPVRLEGVLHARGLIPVRVDSPHAALAELCLAQRAGSKAVLIVCGVREVARLVAAVERFAPGAVVWVYEEGANPPLRPLVLTPKAPVPTDARTPPARPENGRPGARFPALVRENGLKHPPGPVDAVRREPPKSARDVLDDDELEMLLAGEKAMEDPR